MNKATFKNMDGETITVKIGDHVGFKCDIEQSAEVIAIEQTNDSTVLTVKAPLDGFSGHYIGRQNTARIFGSDVWGL